MKVGIKVLNRPNHGVQRVYLAEIENARTSKEVLDEVYRGRQAVGNDNRTMIRCGEDKDFYGVTTKADIINWIDKRLKEDKKC